MSEVTSKRRRKIREQAEEIAQLREEIEHLIDLLEVVMEQKPITVMVEKGKE